MRPPNKKRTYELILCRGRLQHVEPGFHPQWVGPAGGQLRMRRTCSGHQRAQRRVLLHALTRDRIRNTCVKATALNAGLFLPIFGFKANIKESR
jgi:hypothetical protein